jgi:L-amino acid N-acyltransferase YncA
MLPDFASPVTQPTSLEGPAVTSQLDSDRFGILVARAEPITATSVGAVMRSCLSAGVEMVIARCPAGDTPTVHALERSGFLLMETQVRYEGPVVAMPAHQAVRDAVSEDEDAIAEVAASAFSKYGGHYHADPRLSRAACTEAYVSWARRCMSGELAEHVVVAELDGEVVGFQAHSNPRPGAGRLLLVAVAPAAQGRGVYHGLASHAMRWSRERGLSELIAVAHQGNLGSHRVFIKLGLRPVEALCTFHGWADELRPHDAYPT